MSIIKKVNFTDGFSSELTPADTIVGASSFLVGTGVPSPTLGNDGDVYLDSSNGNLYVKASGTWSVDSVLTLPASGIVNTPSGDIIATDVQAAINELDTEKLAIAGGTITGNLIVSGDLSVNGTTTTINTTNLDVTDANITVNNGGTQAVADAAEAGITVEMTDAIDSLIGYDSTVTSKFKVGEAGSTEEILTTNHAQDMTNKTFTDSITSEEQVSTPSTPSTGDQKIYPKTDGEWYSLDSAGLESKLGSGGGFVKVTYHDPISTILPTGTSVTIDGQLGIDGDTVLFSSLTVDANKIYQLSGVGVSLVWTLLTSDFTAGTPENGDTVIVLSGDSFVEAVGKFTGTEWKFNDTVRYYSGADYWEQSSLKTTDIATSTTASVFEVSLAGSENIIVDYSILRGSTKETGVVTITSDGTSINHSQHTSNIGDVGVDLFADINATDLRFRYTSDGGGTGTIKYTVKRWSNTDGGPGGVPSYSGATGGGTAAGSNTDIQYNAGGILAGDSLFQWDTSSSELKLGSIDIAAPISSPTIVDNQTTPTTLFTVDGSLSKFVVCEYSIERGTESRIGSLMICHNGTISSITDVSTDTGGAGIDQIAIPITATYFGGNMIVQYTSDSTGNSGTFKYSLRKWL